MVAAGQASVYSSGASPSGPRFRRVPEPAADDVVALASAVHAPPDPGTLYLAVDGEFDSVATSLRHALDADLLVVTSNES